MHLDRAIALVMMLFMFTSFIWSALKYFKVDDAKGDIGKKIFSLLGLASMVLLITLFFTTSERSVTFNWVASGCFLLSACIFWPSIYYSKKMGGLHFALSEKKSDRLYTAGPYQHIRHPIYTAYSLSWLAGGYCSIHPIAVLPFFMMGVLYVFSAKREEAQFLASELSQSYSAYRNQTGMFFPKIFK